MNFRKSLFVFAIGLFLSPLGLAEELSVTSPDGDIVFKISDNGSVLNIASFIAASRC